jgi:uncharacterized membrane protein
MLPMTTHKAGFWKKTKNNLRNHIFAGVLLIMPFGVTLLVMKWLFGWMAGILRPTFLKAASLLLNNPAILTEPQHYVSFAVSILSILTLFALVYLVGVIGHYVLGKKLIAVGELLVSKIPFVGTIYTATKQVMSAISLPDKAAFKSVVLVDFPRTGVKAVGFFTGYIQYSTGEKYCKVFIPTTPNPTTGFFEIFPINEVTQTNISIEDAFKMIISGGILSPDTLTPTKTNP